jgi:hypothetical protein
MYLPVYIIRDIAAAHARSSFNLLTDLHLSLTRIGLYRSPRRRSWHSSTKSGTPTAAPPCCKCPYLCYMRVL